MEQERLHWFEWETTKFRVKQIKSHEFSYVFLTSAAICIFINSDSFYDTLGSIATFKFS